MTESHEMAQTERVGVGIAAEQCVGIEASSKVEAIEVQIG